MSNKQLGFLIVSIGLMILTALGGTVWYSRLTPMQKCWTNDCKFNERIQNLDAQSKQAESSAAQSAAAYRNAEQNLRNLEDDTRRVIERGDQPKK